MMQHQLFLKNISLVGTTLEKGPGSTSTHTGGILHLLERGLLVIELNPRNVRFGLRDSDLV